MIKHKLIKMMISVGLILATSVTTIFAATYGWEQKGNDWYYMQYDNQYAKGLSIISGKIYEFDATGKLVREIIENTSTQSNAGTTVASPRQSIKNEPTVINLNNNVTVGQATTQNITQLSEQEFYTAVCKESFRLVNEHRKANGIPELTWSAELKDSSKLKSEHMLTNQYFSHDWNGIKFGDLSEQLSGTHPNGENCVGSYQYNPNNLNEEFVSILSKDLFNRWKESPGHNRNMLDASYTKFGFGYAYGNYQGLNMIYGTQQFQW